MTSHHGARRSSSALVAGVLGVALAAGAAAAQRGGRTYIEPNVPYDTRYTFVRLRYTNPGPSGWAFDYPAMERNFMTILNDLTTVAPHLGASNVITMDDPELLNYPIAYLSEPGYWFPGDAEAAGLRNWLDRGGFLIVDDFLLGQWVNFERAMLRVLPDARLVRLGVNHPIFNSFFTIATLDGLSHPQRNSARAEYWGIHEGNDPAGRLIAIINYNNDIGDYMEWTGAGWYPINFTNDAYKLATNYIVYGLSH